MKIKEIAEISQGSIITRVKSQTNKGISLKAISMQEVSYYCNQTDVLPDENFVNVDENKYKNCFISQENDVLIALTTGNAMVIDKDNAGKLILNNFAIIRINDLTRFDPYYLCWLINENKEVDAQRRKLIQKVIRVLNVPVNVFRELEIQEIDINKQKKIGKIYNLIRISTRIKKQKLDIKTKIINNELEKTFKGDLL